MQHGQFRLFRAADMILFAGTRVALGIGVGLLLSRRLSKEQSKAAGIALAAVGGLTTVPLAMRMAARRRAWEFWRQHVKDQTACACGCEFCCPQGQASTSPEAPAA